ncbi:MAG: VOC family protein [Pontibacter sp.]|nr:VOC family protein [Pontibacter sp.]
MKITALTLDTRQPEKLKEFYTHILGFEITSEQTESFTVAAGSTTLTFNHDPKRAEGVYHYAFRIPYHAFESIKGWLEARVAILPDPDSGLPVVLHEAWEAKALYFSDPDGNILEFIAHQSIQESEQPELENGVLSVCEIGLPVPQVPVFAQELKQAFGLEQWKNANPKFEAVGDAYGMFILAEENRNWFPTSLPAVLLPTRVVVEAPLNASINRYGYGIMHVTRQEVIAG